MIIRDMQYADDAAIITNNATELQHELEVTDEQYTRMGLQMNTGKTEVLHRLTDDSTAAQPISIRGSTLKEVPDFAYLGSIISNNCSIDREINNRISRASAAFGQLTGRVYLNRNLKLSTKIRVYQAIVLSILLYGSETWTLYSKQLNRLNAFHLRCLRRMLHITWQDKVPNNVVLTRCDCNTIHSVVAERTLRWAGHVQRMPEERLPKAIFYSELEEGRRPIGRPKKRYKDHLQDTMKKCDIGPGCFETTASDRSAWKQAVQRGISHYETSLRNRYDQRRRARHSDQAGAAVDSGYCCRECNRSFLSAAGLASHQRAHQRRQIRRN